MWKKLFFLGLFSMAIVIGTPTEHVTGASGGVSRTFTHVSGTGTDRFLSISSSTDINTSETVSGVTFDGVSCTQIAQLNDGDSSSNLAVFGLIAPTSSASPLDVVVTFSSTPADEFCGVAITCTDVHQTTPYDVADVQTASDTEVGASNPSVTVPTATGEVVFDAVGTRKSATYTVGANQTDKANIVQSFTHLIVSSQAGADGGVMSGSWSTASPWAQIGYALKPTAAVGGRIMSSLTKHGGLAGYGGIAGQAGGLAG